MTNSSVASSQEQQYYAARQQYADVGVDVDRALQRLSGIAISLHCWQGDDVNGFEKAGQALGGGLAVTGAYPGKARDADELRCDLDAALRLIPGTHRINLHASYGEFGRTTVNRDEIELHHYAGWIDWARERSLGIDFNPTFFSHPLAADGFTLSHPDDAVRCFWVRHGQRCREIGEAIGEALGTTCVTNVWIPDGYKDSPVDRLAPRRRLEESLDRIFARPLNPLHNLDAVEPKLFGIGSESYVVGSHEFYLGYAIRRNKLMCLDAGHYHPTESIADKLTSVLMSVDRVLLHVSRGVRWDSDHVVTLNDDLLAISQELVRNHLLDVVHIGLDFFDASINRIAAWVIGARNLLKSLLVALLEPTDRLRRAELEGDLTTRLALLEECRTLPFGAIWDHYCRQRNVPVGQSWLAEVRSYERNVLARRT